MAQRVTLTAASSVCIDTEPCNLHKFPFTNGQCLCYRCVNSINSCATVSVVGGLMDSRNNCQVQAIVASHVEINKLHHTQNVCWSLADGLTDWCSSSASCIHTISVLCKSTEKVGNQLARLDPGGG